jgi:hypothetical protein
MSLSFFPPLDNFSRPFFESLVQKLHFRSSALLVVAPPLLFAQTRGSDFADQNLIFEMNVTAGAAPDNDDVVPIYPPLHQLLVQKTASVYFGAD